jgi:hypothetical protein
MEIPRNYDPKSAPPAEVFPTDADVALRDKIAAAFLSAHRGWEGNKPADRIIADPLTATQLASIAVTIFRKI